MIDPSTTHEIYQRRKLEAELFIRREAIDPQILLEVAAEQYRTQAYSKLQKSKKLEGTDPGAAQTNLKISEVSSRASKRVLGVLEEIKGDVRDTFHSVSEQESKVK